MPLYDAFISYSHAKDKPVASALQTVMQKLSKPWYRRRALRIFRDDTSLSATPKLWISIETALSEARFLVLLASPEAAASTWVAKEVSYWLAKKNIDTLLIALSDGALAWDENACDFRWSAATPLPQVLRGCFSSEPKWVDLTGYRDRVSLRDPKFIELGADFAATIHGIPREDLLSREVRQQRRALTLAWSAAGLLLLLVAAAGWEWRQATVALDQADRNFTAATGVGTNVVQDVRNLIAGGTISTIVAQPLLDATSKTILALEQGVPSEKLQVLQWRLLDTLSFAYVNVPGRGQKAVELAEKMRSLAGSLSLAKPKKKEYQNFIVTSELRIGDAQGAIAVFDTALAHYQAGIDQINTMINSDPADPGLERLLVYMQQRVGDTLRDKGELDQAEQVFVKNLALAEKLARRQDAKPDWIRALALAHERMGDIYRDLGRPQNALEQYDLYRQVAERLVKLEKPNIPNWAWRLDLWISHQRIGDILLSQGNTAAALKEYKEYKRWAEEVVSLDSQHGEWQRFLANSCVKVGDALLALHEIDAAIGEYTQAERSYRALAEKDHRPRSLRSLAIAHDRLGTALLAKHDIAGARAEFSTCESMQVDEAAFDAQITDPRSVHADCATHLAALSTIPALAPVLTTSVRGGDWRERRGQGADDAEAKKQKDQDLLHGVPLIKK